MKDVQQLTQDHLSFSMITEVYAVRQSFCCRNWHFLFCIVIEVMKESSSLYSINRGRVRQATKDVFCTFWSCWRESEMVFSCHNGVNIVVVAVSLVQINPFSSNLRSCERLLICLFRNNYASLFWGETGIFQMRCTIA